MINWSDPDYTASGGHFAMVLQSVTIKCGTSSNTSLPNSPRSYVYSGLNAQNVPVAFISNATTLLNGAGSAFGGLRALGGWSAVLAAGWGLLLGGIVLFV